jgi:hypothetical protein
MAKDTQAQEAAWQILHDKITEVLDRFGKKDAFGSGDYWLVDDNWGWERHQIEVQNLALLRPHAVKELQALLFDYPDWDMTVQVDVPGKRDEWPGMGIIIYRDDIIDELQREFLPEEFRDLKYVGGKSFLELTGRSVEQPIPEGAARQIARIKRDK